MKNALELEGHEVGLVNVVEGGAIYAEVIVDGHDRTAPSRGKKCGPTKYEQFSMQFGFFNEKPLYDWISNTWNGTPQKKSGAIGAYDSNLNKYRRRQFSNALITETTIPSCNKSLKNEGYITLRFSPEQISPPTANPLNGRPPRDHWLHCNFQLEIPPLDCSGVQKIDAFTVKDAIPNLAVTISESKADTWLQWHKRMVIDGKYDEEKNGILKFLKLDLTERGRIQFTNLGIFKLSFEDGPTEGLVRAELYCEGMKFLFP